MTRPQKGFALIEVALALMVLAALGGITALYLKNHGDTGNASQQADAAIAKSSESCKEQKLLKVCLSASTENASASQQINLTTSVTNTGQADYKYTFGCTYTEPILNINGKDIGVGCNQTLTETEIKARATQHYQHTISGADLKEGPNQLYVVWAEGQSGNITITRKAAGQNELSSQFAICQKQAGLDNLPRICDVLPIILKEQYSNYSCSQWKNLLKPLGLSIPCINLMDAGIGYVYIPKLEHDKWVNKIRTLPQVEDVH